MEKETTKWSMKQGLIVIVHILCRLICHRQHINELELSGN